MENLEKVTFETKNKTYHIKLEELYGYLYWECPICHIPCEEDRDIPLTGESLFCLCCGKTFTRI